MRVRWRGLELPTRLVVDRDTLTDTYGRFSTEPFERGYGTTVGNSLRRVLMSSLEGSAVTSVKIKGVAHEFTTIDGVLEDVTEVILNMKRLVLRLHSDEPRLIRLVRKEAGEALAGMIETDSSVEVINKDFVIATLTRDTELDIEMKVVRGRGYVTAEENKANDKMHEIGVIFVDSIFSPVRKVHYSIEDTRVGQKTNYDRLIVEVWTDGSVNPEMALVEAAKILRKHLNPFVHYYEVGDQIQKEIAQEDLLEATPGVSPELYEILDKPITDLDLSVRARNCLVNADLTTVRQLVAKSEAELGSIRNFGKTSLKEVKEKLEALGFELGMDVDSLAPPRGTEE